MVTKRKKIIVLSVMMLLLVSTGFLNLTLNNQATLQASNNETSNLSFFASYRADRDTARDQQLIYYNSIVESANASEESKSEAQASIKELAAKIEKELLLEGAILSKGFEDVVVSFTDNFVNVIVKSSELQEAEVAQIVEIVQNQTQKPIDNIKIIPME